MKAYFALTFNQNFGNSPVLKEWKTREGHTIAQGDTLFLFGEGPQQKEFKSEATGTFKAFLWREGESLKAGELVAILQVEPEEAKRCEGAGAGLSLTPEEAKGGMSYAEAASIRLPPEETKP